MNTMKRRIFNIAITTLALVAILVACVTLAACDESTHTVSFYNGDTLVESRKVKDGTTTVAPPAPSGVPAGFAFDFWCEKDSDEPYDFNAPIKKDLNLYAHFKPNAEMTGDGSAENPYVLTSAAMIVELAENVAAQDQADFEHFASANYVLGADIDMSGVEDFYGIGRTLEKPFKGNFDGRGFAIKNFSMEVPMRDVAFVGLFGVTHTAVIENLKITNFEYTLDCRTDNAEPYAGGAIGYAVLTNIKNVEVDGKIVTFCSAANSAIIGGLVGDWVSESNYNGTVWASFTENCFAAVEVVIGEEAGVPTVLEDGTAIGGLFGNIGNNTGLHSVINCATAGKLNGGQYVGGIVGNIVGSYVSLINCFSNTYVKASANSVSYAGGIVGQISGNSVVVDCLSTGTVVGKKSAQTSTYDSYCGGVVAYMYEDDFGYYYEPGAGVVNSYYTGSIISNQAVKFHKDSSYKRSINNVELFVTDTLAWAPESWDFSSLNIDGIAKPTNLTAKDIQESYSITLINGGEEFSTIEKSTQNGYDFIYTPSAPDADGNKRFWDWMHFDRVTQQMSDVRYKYYIPVVKDMTLVANMVDVTPIVGTYLGESKRSGDTNSVSVGSIVIKTDGTYVRYNNSGAEAPAPYLFDGSHILLLSQDGDLVEFCCTVVFKAGGPEFGYTDSSMTIDVDYTYTYKEIAFNGEYYSPDGGVIIFSGESGFSMSTSDLLNANGYEDFISGNYTIDENDKNIARLSGGTITNYFSSITFKLNEDGTMTVNAVGKNGHQNLNDVLFSKIESVNYAEQKVLGEYNAIYLAVYGNGDYYQEPYTLTLKADGTALYTRMNPIVGYFRIFGDTIVLELESRISRLKYIEEDDVLFGLVNRGTTRRASGVYSRVENGFTKAFFIDESKDDILFANDVDVFLIKNGQFVSSFTVGDDDINKLRGVTNDISATITLDGKRYIAQNKGDSSTPYKYSLTSIRGEEGTYTYGDKSITLDGIGGVGGDLKGVYEAYSDNLVFIQFDDETFLGFDYVAAQTASYVITAKEHDGYQGSWFAETLSSDSTTSRRKFVLDGFGHATLMYKYIDNDDSYKYFWGGWGTYSITATGVSAKVGEHTIDVFFYHNKQMIYLLSSNGTINKSLYYVNGYEGEHVLPEPPSDIFGTYTGTDSTGQQVILNLDESLNGTFRGAPFHANYDGDHIVYFEIAGVLYSFNYEAKTISYGDENVTLTFGGAITEIIPANFCGTWTGTLSGFNSLTVSIRIDSTGSLVYGESSPVKATYDADTYTIRATVGSAAATYSITMSWNSSDNAFTVTITDEENNYSWTGSVTK